MQSTHLYAPEILSLIGEYLQIELVVGSLVRDLYAESPDEDEYAGDVGGRWFPRLVNGKVEFGDISPLPLDTSEVDQIRSDLAKLTRQDRIARTHQLIRERVNELDERWPVIDGAAPQWLKRLGIGPSWG